MVSVFSTPIHSNLIVDVYRDGLDYLVKSGMVYVIVKKNLFA
jgi:hypothetical protein